MRINRKNFFLSIIVLLFVGVVFQSSDVKAQRDPDVWDMFLMAGNDWCFDVPNNCIGLDAVIIE